MNWGMIVYEVPLERYPDTYNKQPIGLVALASQKNYMSLYVWGPTPGRTDGEFRRRLEGDRQEARHGQVVRPVQEGR